MTPLLRAGLSLLLAAPVASAQLALQKFTADVPSFGEEVGKDVALDGDRLAVARPGSDLDGIADRGSILVYRWTAGDWVLEQEVVAPDAEPWDQLGSCALEGDLLVAGAAHDDVAGVEDAGSVHVFERGDNGWVQVQTLVAPNSLAGDGFGAHVALEGDLLVVGAPETDSPGQPDRGAVHVYRRTAGVYAKEATLAVNFTPAGGAHFGASVAVDAGVVVAGAPGVGPQGTAYVCRKPASTWSIAQQIDVPQGGQGLGPVDFGFSVALRDGLLAVGAPGFLTCGAVATYRDVGGIFQHVVTLAVTDPTNESAVGSDVSLSGGWLAIAAPGADGVAQDVGAVYLHRWNPSTLAWGAEIKLPGPVADPFADLGAAVAIDVPLLVAGAPTEKLVATAFEGSATAFSIMNPAWDYAGGSLPGTHGAPALVGVGNLQPASSVQLALRDARESAPVALFVGTSVLGAPFKGGTLVPMPSQTYVLASNASGELTLSATWPSGIPSGSTLWIQAWIQDPAGVYGWAATNALAATQP